MAPMKIKSVIAVDALTSNPQTGQREKGGVNFGGANKKLLKIQCAVKTIRKDDTEQERQYRPAAA